MKRPEQPEIPAYVRVTEEEARMLFLAVKCWQDVFDNRGPVAEGVFLRLEKIIAEFDLMFERPQVH